MQQRPNPPLLIAGTALVLLGLAVGAVLPVFTNPRMALSSHLQGIVAGGLLILFGLLWPHTSLAARRGRLTTGLLGTGAYAIWIGTLLAAGFGTSRATPIAGAGFGGARWQEVSVSLLLMAGSLASLVGVGSVLLSLLKARRGTGDGSEPNRDSDRRSARSLQAPRA